jgi:hypothetical protein
MQAVLWDRRNNKVKAASDPRGEGQALVRRINNDNDNDNEATQ